MTGVSPWATVEARPTARARISSLEGGSTPLPAPVRTSSRVSASVCFRRARPKVAEARRPGPERRSASSEGTLRRVSAASSASSLGMPAAYPGARLGGICGPA